MEGRNPPGGVGLPFSVPPWLASWRRSCEGRNPWRQAVGLALSGLPDAVELRLVTGFGGRVLVALSQWERSDQSPGPLRGHWGPLPRAGAMIYLYLWRWISDPSHYLLIFGLRIGP